MTAGYNTVVFRPGNGSPTAMSLAVVVVVVVVVLEFLFSDFQSTKTFSFLNQKIVIKCQLLIVSCQIFKLSPN